MRRVCGSLIQFLIAVFVTAGFFGCLFYLLMYGYPSDNKDMINAMLGVLGTIWTLQMNYFFGSSSSSKDKDDTISAIAAAPLPTILPPVQPPNSTTTTTVTNADNVNVNPPPEPKP